MHTPLSDSSLSICWYKYRRTSILNLFPNQNASRRKKTVLLFGLSVALWYVFTPDLNQTNGFSYWAKNVSRCWTATYCVRLIRWLALELNSVGLGIPRIHESLYLKFEKVSWHHKYYACIIHSNNNGSSNSSGFNNNRRHLNHQANIQLILLIFNHTAVGTATNLNSYSVTMNCQYSLKIGMHFMRIFDI